MTEMNSESTLSRLATLEAITSNTGRDVEEIKGTVGRILNKMDVLTEVNIRLQLVEKMAQDNAGRIAKAEAILNQARGGWKAFAAAIAAGAGLSHILDSVFTLLVRR